MARREDVAFVVVFPKFPETENVLCRAYPAHSGKALSEHPRSEVMGRQSGQIFVHISQGLAFGKSASRFRLGNRPMDALLEPNLVKMAKRQLGVLYSSSLSRHYIDFTIVGPHLFRTRKQGYASRLHRGANVSPLMRPG